MNLDVAQFISIPLLLLIVLIRMACMYLQQQQPVSLCCKQRKARGNAQSKIMIGSISQCRNEQLQRASLDLSKIIN